MINVITKQKFNLEVDEVTFLTNQQNENSY